MASLLIKEKIKEQDESEGAAAGGEQATELLKRVNGSVDII